MDEQCRVVKWFAWGHSPKDYQLKSKTFLESWINTLWTQVFAKYFPLSYTSCPDFQCYVLSVALSWVHLTHPMLSSSGIWTSWWGQVILPGTHHVNPSWMLQGSPLTTAIIATTAGLEVRATKIEVTCLGLGFPEARPWDIDVNAECFGSDPRKHSWGWESEIGKKRKPIKRCYQASYHCGQLEPCPAGEP